MPAIALHPLVLSPDKVRTVTYNILAKIMLLISPEFSYLYTFSLKGGSP